MGMPHCSRVRCNNYDGGFIENLKSMFEIPFWPPNFGWMALSHVRDVLRSTPSILRDDESCSHTESTTGVNKSELLSFAAGLESVCVGLCLKCIKAEQYEVYKPCDQHYRGAGMSLDERRFIESWRFYTPAERAAILAAKLKAEAEAKEEEGQDGDSEVGDNNDNEEDSDDAHEDDGGEDEE